MERLTYPRITDPAMRVIRLVKSHSVEKSETKGRAYSSAPHPCAVANTKASSF